MKTETRHLTIEELFSAAGGQSLDGDAGAHLEACTPCSAEVGHWTAIAAGVRHVTAGVEPPPLFPLPALAAAQKGPGGSRSWRRCAPRSRPDGA